MQSTFTSTNLNQTNPQSLPVTYTSNQPSGTPRPGPVLPPHNEQYVPPLQFNRQQGLAFQSAFTPRPPSTNEPLLPRDPQISQSQIVARPGSSKYSNKYSFKKNSTARAKNQSIRNTNDAVQAVVFQESILGSIRSLAATRRGQIESASSTKEGVMLWNTLTEMYNLTLVGNSSQLSSLQAITLNQQNRPQFPNQERASFNKPVRPVQFLQSSQGQQRVQVGAVQPATSRSLNPTKEQFFQTDLANLSLSNNNQLYTRQIRELRGKIEALEHEKLGLVQRIQRNQSSEQDMEHYRSEINALRNQMGQIQAYSHQGSEVTELRENLRHYEEQLIQAHNHIEYLEQSRNEQAQTMQAQVRALQKIVNEHTASVVNRQKGEDDLLREIQYTKAEHQNTIQILNQYSEENAYLKAEMSRLSNQLTETQQKVEETRGHLATAEEYILQLQNTHSQLPTSDLQRQLQALKEDNSRLHIEVSTLRDDINTSRAQAQIYLARAATADNEYNDMECRYRQTVQSLSSRYDELLDQRNALANKLSTSHEASPTGNEEAEALRVSLANLSAQVAESQQHLKTAEAYIQEQMHKWEQAVALKQQHAQQQAFLATIHADLEATRRQNLQLAQRIQDYEHAVAEAERLSQQNDKLTIIIRQKDNAPVSTSLKQIDEVQAALDNYVILHRQSEARVKELEQYLARAQNFIIEQEGKMGESIQNFENENSELKGQLSTAEDYILSLQQASEEERRLLVQAVQGRRAEKKRADELFQHLTKAEDYIAGLHRN